MKIIEYETLDSTNDEAKRLLKSGCVSQSVCVWAHEQTSGRGTQGRVWVSEPKQCLTFSVLLPYTIAHHPVLALPGEQFTRQIGQRLSEVLNQAYAVHTFLKPINDIYAYHPVLGDERKLGGILVEGISQGGQLLGLVVGVGINLQPMSSFLQQAVQADSAHQTGAISMSELGVEMTDAEMFRRCMTINWEALF